MANRHYHFKFNTDRDKTYIDRLDAQENMQGYIKRLILSDIAADGLRDMLHISETDDPDERYHIERENFYSKHCPAIGDPKASCNGCMYFSAEEYGGSCRIEEKFKYEWIRTREASVYGKAVNDGNL